MAINDITFLEEGAFGEIGSRYWQVKANTSTQGTGSSYIPAFRPGEPVRKTLGTGTTNNSAQTLATIGTGSSSYPVVATDFLAGIAMSTSTESDTANGKVYVAPIVPGVVYLGIPDAPTSWDTQSEYDALVGARVLMKQSASATLPVFTVLASDGSTSGLVIEWIDITKYPGKVAFSLRQGLSYTT